MPLTILDPIALSVFSVVGIIVALAELLLGRVRRIRLPLLSLGLASALCGLAGVAYAMTELAAIWQPLVALAACELVLAAFRTRMAGRLAGLPAMQSGLLLLGCVGTLGAQFYRMERDLQTELDLTEVAMSQSSEPPELSAPPSLVVRSDAGRSIPLFTISSQEAASESLESQVLRDLRVTYRAIRTGEADPTTNCHGWVFSGGRHWVRGAFVEAIVADNGYKATTAPAPGDLVVFRNSTGEVTHTGVVRGNADGVVLIESKWGKLGRFIHTSAAHPYGSDQPTFYHSDRGSHLLTGL